MVAFEKEKITAAIRTDFVLSGEIIVITLGVVAQQAFMTQVFVLFAVAIAMTIFVYGIVAGIVRLDDVGLRLASLTDKNAFAAFKRKLGRGLLLLAPWLMKTLTVVGTAAMFMVGGSILAHGWHGFHDISVASVAMVSGLSWVGGALAFFTPLVLEAIFGVLAGATKPHHVSTSNPLRVSDMAGISGNALLRCAVVTANALSLPALMLGAAVAKLSKLKSTWPDNKANCAGLPPL